MLAQEWRCSTSETCLDAPWHLGASVFAELSGDFRSVLLRGLSPALEAWLRTTQPPARLVSRVLYEQALGFFWQHLRPGRHGEGRRGKQMTRASLVQSPCPQSRGSEDILHQRKSGPREAKQPPGPRRALAAEKPGCLWTAEKPRF